MITKNNTNPFFQYVNNNKNSLSLNLTPLTPPETSKNNDTQGANNQKSERKNSDLLNDPRKQLLNTQIVTKPIEEPNKLSTDTRLQNEDLKERRSRSRDGRVSKNRENSQEANLNQKKEEPFHKTKLCPLYQKGQCKKGAQCHFAHGFKQLRGLPNFYKTRLCLSFQKGECKKKSSQCKYAHGKGQLRDLKHDAGYSDTIAKMNREEKTKQNYERRDSNDNRRKNNDRQNRDNRNDRRQRDRRDRQSQSSHRKDRNRRQDQRDGSYDRNKKKQKSDPLAYKKNIPLNKQYEKFLFNNDSNLMAPQAYSNDFFKYQDSMYMIPNGVATVNQSNFNQENYGFPLQKQTEKLNPPLYISQGQQQPYNQYNQKNYKQVPIYPPYNYQDQKSNTKPYYQNLSYNQPQKVFSYSSPQDKFPQKGYAPQNAYGPINPQTQGPYNNEYPPFYQPKNEFIPEFSKEPYYNNFNNKPSEAQSYRSFENNPKVFPQDNGFCSDSFYSQGQKNISLMGSVTEKQSQSFYKNDSFYSASVTNKNDNNFLPSKQALPSNSNGGVYNLYPALDNSVNSNGQKYPYPYEKSKYSSGFSNNLQK